MEDFLNPSPINLNPQNSSTSPFLNDISFQGEGLSLGENIFSKKIEEDPKVEEKPKEVDLETPKTRRRINDFDGDILSKYSGDTTRLTFTGKLREFFNRKKGGLNTDDFREFFSLLFMPGVYRSKTMRASLKKLIALNKMASELVSKKIPYGEATEHYNTLIENLSLATNIQADLKKRIG